MSASALVDSFVDLHCHGGGGYFFSDPEIENIESAVAFHRGNGTDRLLASLVSAPVEELKKQIARLVPLCQSGELSGIHLEGPYLSGARCGAHNPSYLRQPTIAEIESLLAAGAGWVRMVTIAPELEGALAAITYLADHGVIAAIGHSDGGPDDVLRGVDAGASLVTHLSNAMSKLSAGEDSFTSTVLNKTQLPFELIVDGHHVNREDLQRIFEIAGNRVVLVTDAIAAAGQPDGDYVMGALVVEVKTGVARLQGGGALAGSTLTMGEAVANAISFGLTPELATHASIVLPAQILNSTPGGTVRT